jgi:hypothetical protein
VAFSWAEEGSVPTSNPDVSWLRPPAGGLFPSGLVVATPGALAACERAQISPATYIYRHLAGDWGELDEKDRRENDHSLRHGWRLLSAYRLPTGERLWIITEADRSATTVLLPSEY